ncbi:hypothetical protein GGS23DRAFT_547336 [Durotheca rogersii]|uniref:uncharacterized protein n=1 Tax=Durotheca rogersii TaxID=419775 RepID=UPI002220D3FA|nr:uncharacterized protein GGS23DRAFT_547336 [Durotheca rogersii]KAI5867210.1 hypothetical protein GGS23DRAFT_547336 [Durotheca rogersii]
MPAASSSCLCWSRTCSVARNVPMRLCHQSCPPASLLPPPLPRPPTSVFATLLRRLSLWSYTSDPLFLLRLHILHAQIYLHPGCTQSASHTHAHAPLPRPMFHRSRIIARLFPPPLRPSFSSPLTASPKSHVSSLACFWGTLALVAQRIGLELPRCRLYILPL